MYIIAELAGQQIFLTPYNWCDLTLPINLKKGDVLHLNKILVIKEGDNVQFGQPFIDDTFYFAKVIKVFKAKKVIVLKTKPKKNYTKKQGHRQSIVRIQWEDLD
jgi:large subunit ribosomal protein L21